MQFTNMGKEGTSLQISWTLKIIKECYGQLYTHSFDNLDKIVQFLERHNPPKLMQEEIDNLKETE